MRHVLLLDMGGRTDRQRRVPPRAEAPHEGVQAMTTPVDRVAALARVLFETRQREEYPGEESRWDDWKDGQDGDTSRAQARVALAHARGLVPGEEFCHDGVCGNTDQCSYHEARSAFRAETLRRLGGEGKP